MLMVACGVSVNFLIFFRKYWDCLGVERYEVMKLYIDWMFSG